jgi:glutaredoxin
MPKNTVTVYGTETCPDTQAVKNHLDSLGVQFRYKDVETDPQAEAWMKAQNDGQRKMPTVDVDGIVLSVPAEPELEKALRARWLMA